MCDIPSGEKARLATPYLCPRNATMGSREPLVSQMQIEACGQAAVIGHTANVILVDYCPFNLKVVPSVA